MLFNLPTTALPSGIAHVPDFISPAEEAQLVGHLDFGGWSSELRRRVQHFGYRYDYKARRVTPESHLGPLPGWIAPLAQKLANDEHFADTPDQVIANEYLPGQGISKHVDCEPCSGPSSHRSASCRPAKWCSASWMEAQGPASFSSRARW